MTVVVWLVPVCAFLVAAPMYYGGFPIRFEGGGGVRQSGGLLLSFAAYLTLAVMLRGVLDGMMATFFAVVISTIVSLLLVPLLSRLAFRVFGVRIVQMEDAGPAH
jgi:hypothetical protein